jgi:hypothetical protein
MRFIVKSMDYIIDELLDVWDNVKETILEFAEFGVAIVNAIIICIFFLTIPIWIIPYLIFRRRNKKE